jgi:hypothetical protein
LTALHHCPAARYAGLRKLPATGESQAFGQLVIVIDHLMRHFRRHELIALRGRAVVMSPTLAALITLVISG